MVAFDGVAEYVVWFISYEFHIILASQIFGEFQAWFVGGPGRIVAVIPRLQSHITQEDTLSLGVGCLADGGIFVNVQGIRLWGWVTGFWARVLSHAGSPVFRNCDAGCHALTSFSMIRHLPSSTAISTSSFA